MKLLVLFGPPAVGKTTVGQLIEKQTDFKLFHNHMVMDGVMHIFGVGTPTEDRLSKIIRTTVIEAAAEDGIDLIFTYVWNFGREKGKQNIDTYKQLYESRGGQVRFVELAAPLETRVARANSPDRLRYKAHAPRGDEVAALEEKCSFTSPSPFYYPDAYTKIDTTGKSPEQAAREIVASL
ncbi:MAG: shikimate kinase [Candidatus Saccharimonadales bacterium]